MSKSAVLGINTAIMPAFFACGAQAQSAKDGPSNDGAFPPGFDCNSLSAPKTKLECQTLQQNRTPDNDTVPPGTPAIPMPGAPNAESGDVGPNPGPQDFTRGKSTGSND